jgi:hypothetical protein
MASALPANDLTSFPDRLFELFLTVKAVVQPKARHPNRDFKKNLLSFGASIFAGSSFELKGLRKLAI